MFETIMIKYQKFYWATIFQSIPNENQGRPNPLK